MGYWKAICSCVGCIAAAGICVASGGMATPFIAANAAPWIIGGGTLGGFFLGDKIDQENVEAEKRLKEDKNYQNTSNELGKQEDENKQTQNAINTIVGKLNGNIPREKNETDEYLKQQLIIYQSQLDNGKRRVKELREDLDRMRKELLGGGFNLMKILGLDKMKMMDKIMLIGGAILIIYLLKG